MIRVFYCSGPEIVDNEDESGDEIMDEPGPSSRLNSKLNGKPSVPQNWNSKPKSPVQLAGETLVTRIVAEVSTLELVYNYQFVD